MMRPGAGAAATAALAGPEFRQEKALDWDDLDGWVNDDHAAALSVFRETCGAMVGGDWSALCVLAAGAADPRAFFENSFRAVLITDGRAPLFTGYYEPELPGSRHPTGRFRVPLYRRPDDLPEDRPWLARAEIETTCALVDRGLEIAWIEHPVDRFFLQVQGSGRIRLAEGGILRVGFGGGNGHHYRSVGREMVRRGILAGHEITAQAVRTWVAANGAAGEALLRHNPSYAFFREIVGLAADRGPLGTMNRPLTEGRSVAVDPAVVPLGAPVWLEKDGPAPTRRLMIAQDTGAAIRGAQRADIFCGTGAEAGRIAGGFRDGGRMVMLLPAASAAPGS